MENIDKTCANCKWFTDCDIESEVCTDWEKEE